MWSRTACPQGRQSDEQTSSPRAHYSLALRFEPSAIIAGAMPRWATTPTNFIINANICSRKVHSQETGRRDREILVQGWLQGCQLTSPHCNLHSACVRKSPPNPCGCNPFLTRTKPWGGIKAPLPDAPLHPLLLHSHSHPSHPPLEQIIFFFFFFLPHLYSEVKLNIRSRGGCLGRAGKWWCLHLLKDWGFPDAASSPPQQNPTCVVFIFISF